ncbi:MAG: hypothetical protein KJ621_08540 [Proteobacteria bacterium]|nr:hypothetical protein [Pseudomonadota bacterium]MBU1739905.1 hypothetical protein [Pseudomonadota bacterium]
MDVRRYLADLINRLEAGKIEPALAGRAGYLANILLRAIEAGELEDRVKALEDALSRNGQPGGQP